MSQWGGNKKKRPRDNGGWGAYYANKNANKKDRYAEFDSSTSRAINAGQQPTLARKRRQLAEDNNKLRNDPASSKRAQDIFEDLIRSHRENNSFSGPNKRIKANPPLINGRKSFWRRRLSNLSTRDYDAAWKEGRNNFLKFINNQRNEATASTATSNIASADSTTTDAKSNNDRPPTGSHKNKKAVDDPKPKAKKSSATSKPKTNSQKPTSSTSDKSKPSSDTNANKKAVDDPKPKAKKSNTNQNHTSQDKPNAQKPTLSISNKPNLSSGTKAVGQKNIEVIDLCDSDSDDEIRDQHNSEKNLERSQSKKQVTTDNNKQLPTKKEADVSESIAPVANTAPATATTAQNKTVSNEIPKASTTRKRSIPNRWANLFLGPNFRTDHVFSLDN